MRSTMLLHTKQAVWYLNNNVFVGGAFGPTLPANWSVVGVADFNGDNKPDYAALQCCYTPNRRFGI